MKRILAQVEAAKEALPAQRLFKWLADESVDGARRLSFTPSMLYYLMGFKDVLEALEREHPTTKLDEHVNAYCGEDAEHWRWYLEDLEKLGYDLSTWGSTIPNWCNEVWSRETQFNRRAVFDLIAGARSCADPLFALSLILVFEATGVVFIGHTRKAAIALNMDDDLKYFGRVHFEEEFGHSVQARDLLEETMDEEVYRVTSKVVEDLFKVYDGLFDTWYQHRDRYVSKGVLIARKARTECPTSGSS